MATFYLDFENGNDSNDGTTFANRWKTITSGATAARLTPGDTIRVMKSPDPVSLGVNGTFTKLSPTITLASAVTANVSLCQAGWTASANASSTTSTTRKEGTLSTSITTLDAFTTGLIAYEATGTLDLSAYQKISFWIRPTINMAANALRLDLCSDTAGATPVNSFTIDQALVGSPGASRTWTAITLDNGAALGSSIKSVALVALTDFGAATIQLDNIFVTNNLSLTSLIGTSSSATGREWYPVRSVNGTTVIMETSPIDASTVTSRGFSETTTTTTAYVREPIRIAAGQTTNENGSVTARYTFSGGWDRTNMSTQNGMTFITSAIAQTLLTNARTQNDFEYFGFNYASALLSAAANDQQYSYCYFGSANNNSINASGNTHRYLNCNINAYIGSSFATGVYDTVYVSNAGTAGLITVDNAFLKDCTFANNAIGISDCNNIAANNLTLNSNTTGIGTSDGMTIDGLTTNSNTTVFSASSGNVNNWTTTSDTTLVATSTNRRERLNLSRYSTYAGAQYNGSTLVVYDVNTPVHGTTTRSWRHDVQSNQRSWLPITQRLQPFAVGASTLVTFSIWTQRSSTSVVGVVRLRGNIVAGVNADVTATASAAINTWEQLTITFTPSAAGAAIIELESYSTDGNTGSVFFGDASVSQA